MVGHYAWVKETYHCTQLKIPEEHTSEKMFMPHSNCNRKKVIAFPTHKQFLWVTW